MEPHGNSKYTVRAWLWSLLAVTALVYSRALGNGFVADDYDQIVRNRYLGQWSFLWRSMSADAWWFFDPSRLPQGPLYRPLQNIWFALNFHLFGLNPIGWHAATIALHLLVVGMVYRVASILCGDRWTGLFAGALFALMPTQIEAVIWAGAIGTPLSALFELCAFEFYLRGSTGKSHDPHPLILSLGAFTLALLSYEAAIAFPALVAAHVFLLGGEGDELHDNGPTARWRRAITAAWPYAVVVAGYLGLRILVLGFISQPQNPMTYTAAALTLPGALLSCLMLLLLPWRADLVHPVHIVRSIVSPGFLIPVGGLIAFSSSAALLLRRDPRCRLYAFCAAWILIAFAPLLHMRGLFNPAAMEDHFIYFPAFGVCVIAADLTMRFAAESERNRTAIAVAGAILLTSFAGRLIYLEGFWRDDAAMFSRCTEIVPGSAVYHDRFGMALASRGDYQRARSEFYSASQDDPAIGTYAYNLALADEKLGKRSDAAREMAEGLKRLPQAPPDGYAELAVVADSAGDKAQSESALKHAESMPGGAEIAARTRAQILFLHNDRKGAEEELRRLLRQNPADEQALASLGAVLLAVQRYEDALTVYRQAAAIAPAEPALHFKIAVILHQTGRDREAHDECAAVLAAAPYDPKAQALMAAIEQGDAPH
ncbi:MAG TPA: tetratricopeptide repeat protein [Candidatus Binataceae bacterium]|nr:tetratricopeptide repeat protein [Candidatus Binataceae bacterium]